MTLGNKKFIRPDRDRTRERRYYDTVYSCNTARHHNVLCPSGIYSMRFRRGLPSQSKNTIISFNLTVLPKNRERRTDACDARFKIYCFSRYDAGCLTNVFYRQRRDAKNIFFSMGREKAIFVVFRSNLNEHISHSAAAKIYSETHDIYTIK